MERKCCLGFPSFILIFHWGRSIKREVLFWKKKNAEGSEGQETLLFPPRAKRVTRVRHFIILHRHMWCVLCLETHLQKKKRESSRLLHDANKKFTWTERGKSYTTHPHIIIYNIVEWHETGRLQQSPTHRILNILYSTSILHTCTTCYNKTTVSWQRRVDGNCMDIMVSIQGINTFFFKSRTNRI